MNSRTTILLLLVLLTACSPERDPQSLYAPADVDVLVVDMVLLVGADPPNLILSRTQPPGAPYDLQRAGERGATVTLSSGAGDVMSYRELSPGLYASYQPWARIRPETVYDLHVVTDRGEVLDASTTTPPRIAVDSWVLLPNGPDQQERNLRTFEELGSDAYYAPENQLTYAEGILEARFDPVAAAGYQLALFSIDPDAELVIDPPFLDEEDLASLDREGSSPAFEAEDGRVRLPWFAVYYGGRHRYVIYALDLNWYDLLRTSDVNGGSFGGNAGDGVERPLFHVEGGIGLFGSASGDSVGFYVHPAP